MLDRLTRLFGNINIKDDKLLFIYSTDLCAKPIMHMALVDKFHCKVTAKVKNLPARFFRFDAISLHLAVQV